MTYSQPEKGAREKRDGLHTQWQVRAKIQFQSQCFQCSPHKAVRLCPLVSRTGPGSGFVHMHGRPLGITCLWGSSCLALAGKCTGCLPHCPSLSSCSHNRHLLPGRTKNWPRICTPACTFEVSARAKQYSMTCTPEGPVSVKRSLADGPWETTRAHLISKVQG